MDKPTQPTDVIPKGPYCYEPIQAPGVRGYWFRGPIPIRLCPYWSKDESKPSQMNGSCSYLGINDWDDSPGVSLLWDQIKECGINDDDENG